MNSPAEYIAEEKSRPATAAGYKRATFAAGCFWGVEAAYRRLNGVVSTSVGYTGGRTANPIYPEVCSGRTGHAEAVEVVFDPNAISYGQLLEVFWNIHDPTSARRQGRGSSGQYRSAVFYHNLEQRTEAFAVKERLEQAGRFAGQILTQILPASGFYKAEEYHQQFLDKRGSRSCSDR